MITKTKKLLTAILFLSLAIFAGVVGVLTLNNPKLNGTINIGNEVFEARIERNTGDYFYYQTLSSAFSNAMEGETIEVINPVSLNTKIEINQNISLVSRYVLGKSTNRDIKITTSGTGGFSVASSANLSLGKMAGNLSFQSTGTTSPFEIDGEVEITGGEFSTSTNNAIFDITASGTLTLKSGIIIAQNRAITNNGTLKIEKSPYIEGEIYLATGKYITFENEAWIKPLQISTEITTGTVKIAQRTSSAISFDSKIDESSIKISEEIKKTTYVNKYVTGNGSLNENGNDLEVTFNLEVIDATSDLRYQLYPYPLNVDEEIYRVVGFNSYYDQIEAVIPNYYDDGANGVRPVRVIAGSAFRMHKYLSVFLIPDSVTIIDPFACSANAISSLIIPDSVISIENSAFANNQLTSVIIGNSVTSIGNSAFSNNQLTSVNIPSSVTSIGSNPFSSNPTLISLVVASENQNYKSENNYLLSKNGTQLIAYGDANKAINDIPNSVEIIGDSAFSNNQLISVIIPNSLASIGDYAFQNNQLASVTIPNNVTSIGNYAFQNNQLASVTIPNNVTSIGNYAFSSNQLTSVTIGAGVTSIGSSAFANNTTLTTVTIDSTATAILTYSSASSNGYLLQNRQIVYVKDTVSLSGSYITNQFSERASDKTGYKKYMDKGIPDKT